MGCVHSKEAGHHLVGNRPVMLTDSPQANAILHRHPPHPTVQDTQGYQQPANNQPNFKLTQVVEDAELPDYHPEASVDYILRTILDAENFSKHGIKGAFNVLGDRHFNIFIDSSHSLSSETRCAILLVATVLLIVAQAKDCDMTFYFTSYPNKKSKNLSEIDRRHLKDLINLWKTQSWQEALGMVRYTQSFQEKLGIQDWINKRKNISDEQSDVEKHAKLLNFCREKMLTFWHGWHQRELTVDSLEKLYGSAMVNASQQLNSLNSTAFTYKRAMGQYTRLQELYQKDPSQAFPVSNIFLLGTAIQPTELAAIQEAQNIGASSSTTRYSKPESLNIEGRGTLFQISSVVMIDRMTEKSIKLYKKVDNYAKGEDDINDLNTLKERKVLTNFLSPGAFFKILNSHEPAVDNDIQMPTGDAMYGRHLLNATGHTITLPSVKQVKRIFGIEDLSTLPRVVDDSDDEEDRSAPLRTGRARFEVSTDAAERGSDKFFTPPASNIA
ncbi:hypothetical protein CEP51_010611 [Fusarium floridanum]|uniref:Uncharacterized protein n=1 Tax=Fusarium floridanum TaxID=1325733 RepID=A0A428RDX4_9HYPO|nr:hypothetical protein CEP51_010611 [Fusarium floridanum]